MKAETIQAAIEAIMEGERLTDGISRCLFGWQFRHAKTALIELKSARQRLEMLKEIHTAQEVA